MRQSFIRRSNGVSSLYSLALALDKAEGIEVAALNPQRKQRKSPPRPAGARMRRAFNAIQAR
jgi:hypothetical protein